MQQVKLTNRAAKRHQKKSASKAAKKNRRDHPPQPLGQGLGGKLEAAVSHHQAGRLDQAKRLYSAILSREPKQVVALNFLGVIAHQQGDARRATALIGKALALRPNYAEAHNDLGNALKDLGKLDEAVAS